MSMLYQESKSMEQINQFVAKWEKFVDIIHQERNINLKSWKRCEGLNINPDNLEFNFLSEDELASKLKENKKLIEVAIPYMEQVSSSLQGKPHVVALSDSEGWILEILGTKEEFGGRSNGFDIGASWAEEYLGNNGIGTTLVEERPILVYGNEHYATVYHNVACLGVPIKNQNGKVVAALDVSVPVKYTHPRRITMALTAVNAIENELSLQERIESMEKIVATNIHDLRNPLTIIQSLTKLGSMKTKSEEQNRYFKRISEQIDILSNMLNNILAIHKPEKYILIPIEQAMQEIIKEIKPLCKARRINFEFFNRNQVMLMLRRKIFKRAIHNLLINAINAMDDEGEIMVQTSQIEDKLRIEISDTGPGIPPEIEDNIFQPFVKQGEEGTGLGLYMVYQTIVEVHQGEIWFETKAGAGTTFYIELPIVKEDSDNLERKLH